LFARLSRSFKNIPSRTPREPRLRPGPGQWYEDSTARTFSRSVRDPDEEIVRIQWLDSEIQDIDLDTWNEWTLSSRRARGWVDEDADDEDDDDSTRRARRREDDEDDWTTRTKKITTTKTTSIAIASERSSTRLVADLPAGYPTELERTWLAPTARGRPSRTAPRRLDVKWRLPRLSGQTLHLRMQYSTRSLARDAARLLQLDYFDTLASAHSSPA